MKSVILTLCVVVYAAAADLSEYANLTQGSELLLAFVVHRHGDRTPVTDTTGTLPNLSDDSERDQRLSFPYGEGGLTNAGKVRGYKIGEYLRNRYDHMLSDIYFMNEIYLQSTDVERTKMTLLTALAAMYPPKSVQRWSRNLNWQPIPYTTFPQSQDFMTFFYGCAKSQRLMAGLYGRPIPAINEKHGDLLELLTDNLPFNFTQTSSMVFMYNDLLVAQAAIGVPAPAWIAPYLDELYNAASLSLRELYNDEQIRRLAGGVFLNEFFSVAEDIISDKKVDQRVRIYSAHDINVASQLAAGLLPVVAPKYGSVLSLELYRIKKTGQHIVLPVYLPQAGNSSPRVLPIEGCGYLCPLNKYRKLTAPYTLTHEQHKEECNA